MRNFAEARMCSAASVACDGGMESGHKWNTQPYMTQMQAQEIQIGLG